MGRKADLRWDRLRRVYDDNARECETFGHEYMPDAALNGDYACRYCRAARALTPLRDIDKSFEVAR